MAKNGWTQLKMAKIAQKGWKWLEMTGTCWKCLPNGSDTTWSPGLVLSDIFVTNKILREDEQTEGKAKSL